MYVHYTVYAMIRKKSKNSLSENGRAQNPLLNHHFLRKSVLYYRKTDKSIVQFVAKTVERKILC